MVFFNEFELDPASGNIGKIGEYLFQSALARIKGLAWINFNEIGDDPRLVGDFYKRRKLRLNYRKKSGVRDIIPFRFKNALRASLFIEEILTASPIIDYLVILPSERPRVTLVEDKDCYFVEVKTLGKTLYPKYSLNQKWVFYKYKDLNIKIAEIDLSLNHSISFNLPSSDYEPFIAPCGKELPNPSSGEEEGEILLSPCHEFCRDYPCKLYIEDLEKAYIPRADILEEK